MPKPRKFIAVSDNHGHHYEPRACAAMFDFLKSWKPDLRIHLGDCFDMTALRRGASDDDKRTPLSDDVAAGCDFLRKFSPTHFLRGNHDERLWDLLDVDDAKLSEYALKLVDEIRDAIGDAKMLPYHKRNGVLKIGKLSFIHGYHSGLNAARMAAQVFGSVLMGHVHTIDQFSVPGLEPRIGRAIGCMCQVDATYNRAQANTLRQTNGFSYGFIFPSGHYQVFQAEGIAGTWYMPSEFRCIQPR